MTLALVIAVRDDQRNLDRLLRQVALLRIFGQIVIVDDASRAPVELSSDITGPRQCPVILLRNQRPEGAGAARNQGLRHVSADHVIFFDSDDLFTDAIADLWMDLHGRDFDFCLMRYQDSERGHFGGIGQNLHDEACWSRAGITSLAPVEASTAQRGALAEAGNFPWNKIYRTDFLRMHNIRCGTTRVHNDVLLHWHSFAVASRVLVSARICAIHVVRPRGGRLTNATGHARLELFRALGPAAQLVCRRQGDDLVLPFLRFCAGVLIWAETVASADIKGEFARRRRAFLRRLLTPALHDVAVRSDPVLALRLSLLMVAGAPRC